MSVKREAEATAAHPPRRATCKRAPDRVHTYAEASRDNYGALLDDNAEDYVWWACEHCGKRRLTVEKREVTP